jgi:hypothetical protein
MRFFITFLVSRPNFSVTGANINVDDSSDFT